LLIGLESVHFQNYMFASPSLSVPVVVSFHIAWSDMGLMPALSSLSVCVSVCVCVCVSVRERLLVDAVINEKLNKIYRTESYCLM